MTNARSAVALLAATVGFFASSTDAALPSSLGWYYMPNTKLRSVCAAENGYSAIAGASGCAAITFAWNGAVFDTKRNRLIIWGGGHNDYYGNEIYAVNLDSQTIQRLTNPAVPGGTSSPCQEAIANGTQPNSRHTYDGIEYVPTLDKMFVFGGSLSCSSGNFGRDTWMFNFVTNTWERKNPSGPIPRAIPGMLTAYDKNTGLVYVYDDLYLYSYDPNADRYTQLTTNQQPVGYHLNATIDPVRRKFVIVGYDNIQGRGLVRTIDLSPGSNYQLQTISTTGGDGVIRQIYPGLEYDPVSDRIVAWGGSTKDVIYSLNLDTRQWTTVTYSGGPRAVANGTHGRFRYSPASNVFVLANSVDDDVAVVRLTSGTGSSTPPTQPTQPTEPAPSAPSTAPSTPDEDFAARCSAPGVVKCIGFDNTTTDIVRGVNLWPDGKGTYRAGLDTTTKSSGSGSLRFDLPPPPHAGPNIAGSWSPQSAPLFGRTFGENSTFYVQYRMRLSNGMINGAYGYGVNWKTSIFHYNNKTCGPIELTTSNYYGMPLAQLDTDCGSRWMWTTLDGSQHTNSPPLLMQQTESMQCAYGSGYTYPKCVLFRADEWMTLYYKIQIGKWDQPNSNIEAWLAYEGSNKYERFVRMTNFRLSCNSDVCTTSPGINEGYNNITFTPYMTGLSSSVGPSSTQRMWFDELIISTQPIALPGGGTKPNPPANLTVR